MRAFQRLETPQLVELGSETTFVIVTEIDVSEMKNGLIFMRGKAFHYDDGNVGQGGSKEIQYSVTEDAHFEINSAGEIID